MSIYVLKDYVEKCLKNGVEPTFEGLNIYYRQIILSKSGKI